MIKFKVFFAAALAGGALTGHAAAGPVAVELFTSQSCSSCVAAGDYFEELAKGHDVVALGWHVDYWNSLQTRHGQWVDPYSSRGNTERQRRYNQAIRSRSAVYTPQMVVAGQMETVGSSRPSAEELIARAQRAQSDTNEISARQQSDSNDLSVRASGDGEACLVTFIPLAKTNVAGGENAGVHFVNINVVTGARKLGTVSGQAFFTATAPTDGEACAVLLQKPDLGPILAAQYCETP